MNEQTEQVREYERQGCPLARELRVLHGMCSCAGDMAAVREAEAEYLRLRLAVDIGNAMVFDR